MQHWANVSLLCCCHSAGQSIVCPDSPFLAPERIPAGIGVRRSLSVILSHHVIYDGGQRPSFSHLFPLSLLFFVLCSPGLQDMMSQRGAHVTAEAQYAKVSLMLFNWHWQIYIGLWVSNIGGANISLSSWSTVSLLFIVKPVKTSKTSKKYSILEYFWWHSATWSKVMYTCNKRPFRLNTLVNKIHFHRLSLIISLCGNISSLIHRGVQDHFGQINCYITWCLYHWKPCIQFWI